MSEEEMEIEEMEEIVTEELAVDGELDMAIGADELDDARDVAAVGVVAAAAAASDLTRAVDAEVVADRLATLSDLVGVAGVNDISEGVDLLSASDDVDAMSAMVGLMSLGDVERGLELGRVAGELMTIANVVDELDMPILSAVLDDRGMQLQDIATDVILRAAAERSLAQPYGRHRPTDRRNGRSGDRGRGATYRSFRHRGRAFRRAGCGRRRAGGQGCGRGGSRRRSR